MDKLKKLFGGFKMTWPRVIIFAVITAVWTALINQVPFLQDTSFIDIAVYLECWILFAVFICVNCEKWWEAALKCFVFFLISQPLIYLIEVPFLGGWGIFRNYPYWAKITMLTLPGGAIAFFVKKKNWLSALILAVPTAFLAYSFTVYLHMTCDRFPRHLLSCIFCAVLVVFFALVLLEDKKQRAALIALFAAAVIAIVIFQNASTGGTTMTVGLGEGEWTIENGGDGIVSVEIVDGNAQITSIKNGAVILDFVNENGETVSYNVVADGKNLAVDIID